MTSPQQRGAFITFEGPDGSGKTTQIAHLADWLRRVGHEPVVLRQPGGTVLGEAIRSLLLDSRAGGGVAPLTELALMFADRAQSIRDIILPAIQAGRVVLCDRYTDSSEAYQGGGRGLGTERVLAVHQAICDGLQPDLTVLLLPDVTTALHRARQRNQQHCETVGTDENRFETESDAFYRRVHQAYEDIALREPNRVHTFRGDDSIEAVAVHVREVVLRRFPHLSPVHSTDV